MRLEKFLSRTLKEYQPRGTTQIKQSIEIRNVCTSEGFIRREKRQATDGRRCPRHISLANADI